MAHTVRCTLCGVTKEFGGECACAGSRQFVPGLPITPIERALAVQHGGDHYKKLTIQPVEYIHANNIGFMEGSAIKYLTRWRDKGGLEDLKKAKHFIELLIELEGGDHAKV